MTEYRFREFYIPTRMMEGIELYIKYGIKPGDFLTAIITNDLKAACGRADDENLRNIPAYVAYFYNQAPAGCYGCEKAIRYWIERGGLYGGRNA